MAYVPRNRNSLYDDKSIEPVSGEGQKSEIIRFCNLIKDGDEITWWMNLVIHLEKH